MQKGVTTIIATILLVLITISIAGVSFVFLGRTQSAAAQSGEERLEETLSQIGTSFKIDYVDKNKVFIRNLGNRELKNLDFYVNNIRMKTAPITIAPKEIGEFTLDDSKLSMMSDPLELKVVSGRTEAKSIVSFYEHYTVGQWKFNEGHGSVAEDSSSNKNDAKLLNGISWTKGKYGNAVKFDGIDDYIIIKISNTTKGLAANKSFTVSFWMNYESQPARIWVLFIGNKSSPKYTTLHWLINQKKEDWGLEEGIAQFGIWQLGQNLFNLSSNKNQFTHVVTTYDNISQKLETYINGEKIDSDLIGSTKFLQPLDINIGSVLGALQGQINMSRESNFKGIIDDVRILRIARSMEKV